MIYSGWYGMSGEYFLISSIQVWCGELPSTDAIEPIHSSFYWSESDLDLEDKDRQISADIFLRQYRYVSEGWQQDRGMELLS